MAQYQLQLLGGFQFSRGGIAIPIASAKQKVLIAFLAVADPKPGPLAS